jgi:hypothetical protein
MSGTGLYVGQRKLLYNEVPKAIAERWNVTNSPVYPEPFKGTTRFPETPSLEPINWTKLTENEKIAKASADKLKECDTMQKELKRLKEFEQYIITLREEQLAGFKASNSLLPSPIPPTPRSRPPPRLSDKITTRENSGHVRLGGLRRKTTRRRKIRRRKTKRAKN